MSTNIFPFLAQGLVLAATATLAVSLILVRRLVAQLPAGAIRSRWNLLSVLILAFISSYLVHILVFWNAYHSWHDLIVPAVFFFGSAFVWMTVTLALQTTRDLRQLVKLEHENITDPLTGIFNRRYLERRLEEETSRALRYKMPLSILMLDVDHFKRINDTHGHPAGDRVLLHLGKILTDTVRNLDVVARYGGEEFLIVAPDTPSQTAAGLAKRLHQQVSSTPLRLTDANGKQLEIPITVSIGGASLNYQIDSQQKLIQSADAALYQAKQNGRNQIVFSDANFGE